MRFIILVLLFASSVVFARGTGFSSVASAMADICAHLITLLPVVSMLMIIGAGVVYASGQLMGAETRARANTWATAMLVGAIIAILIVVVAPPVLGLMYGGDVEGACNIVQLGG